LFLRNFFNEYITPKITMKRKRKKVFKNRK